MHDPLEIFRTVIDAVAAIVDTEPEPHSETPCSDWNYAQLLDHLTGGDRLFVGLLTGRAALPAGARMAPGPDQPPPSPADYRAWSTRAGRPCSATPRSAPGPSRCPAGRLTGDQVIVLRSVEHFLHGWDLAKAAGAPTIALEPVATALDGPARQLLAAVGDRTLGERRPFAPSVDDRRDRDPGGSAGRRLRA